MAIDKLSRVISKWVGCAWPGHYLNRTCLSCFTSDYKRIHGPVNVRVGLKIDSTAGLIEHNGRGYFGERKRFLNHLEHNECLSFGFLYRSTAYIHFGVVPQQIQPAGLAVVNNRVK